MKQKFTSLSKRLSRRILMVSIAMITILALCIISFSINGLIKMNDTYFLSILKATNETITRSINATDQDGFYQTMKNIDTEINKSPFFGDINRKISEDMLVYNIVIDSVGTYLYHPDKQRIGKRNFFDDIAQTSDDFRKEFTPHMAHSQTGTQIIVIDGISASMYYTNWRSEKWTNAIIVPRKGLIIQTIEIGLILLSIIALGLLAAYWMNRLIIRRATQPLRLLASSTDEVAQGNFHNPLPQLDHNDEISLLRDSFDNMQQSLTQYIEQLKTATAQRAAFESELQIARDIQLSIVPTTFPELTDADIYASMTPAKAVGGDLYDFFERDRQLYFCIGDVSGKGVPAALFMTMTKSLFRAYTNDGSTPDRIVTRMNNDLNRDNDTCMFVTLFVGILDLQTGQLNYCNAGHEAPIVITDEARPLHVNCTLPVGAYAGAPYVMETIQIEPQTTLLLYTDGLNEAMNADEKMFGEQRIADELSRAISDRQLDPKTLTERMLRAVHDFVGDTEQSDDLTMLTIRWK